MSKFLADLLAQPEWRPLPQVAALAGKFGGHRRIEASELVEISIEDEAEAADDAVD